MLELRTLITDFAWRIAALVEAGALARTREDLLRALGESPPKRRGRPPKARPAAVVATRPERSVGYRKKAPIQLCPVPKCKNPAAPIFGMVCSKHQDVPKAKIKKFREARRAKKLSAGSRRARKLTEASARPRRRAKTLRTAAKMKSIPATQGKRNRRSGGAKAAAKDRQAVPATLLAATTPEATQQAAS